MFSLAQHLTTTTYRGGGVQLGTVSDNNNSNNKGGGVQLGTVSDNNNSNNKGGGVQLGTISDNNNNNKWRWWCSAWHNI